MSYIQTRRDTVTLRNEWINSRPYGILAIQRLGTREVNSLVGFQTMLDVLERCAERGVTLPSDINWLPADRDYWQFLRDNYGR